MKYRKMVGCLDGKEHLNEIRRDQKGEVQPRVPNVVGRMA